MISWLTSLSLVEFGIASDVGPYSSSMFIWVTETKVEVREKPLLMRKHGGVDFPPFRYVVSANAVMKEWAVRPWRPDWLEGRERKPPYSPFVSFYAHLQNFNCLPSAKDHSLWRQSPAAVHTLGEERKGTKKKIAKMGGLKYMKQAQIRYYSLVMSLEYHSVSHLPDQPDINNRA